MRITGHVLRGAVVAMGVAANGAGQQSVAVHSVGATVAVTKEPLKSVVGIRVLSDGRVMVNDAYDHRLLLFDATLSTCTVVMDTLESAVRSYGTSGYILAYAGDSTLFYDGAATALVVIDPKGKIARVMAPPFVPDAGYIGPRSGARFDPAGHLVYLANISPRARPTPSGGFPSVPADSAPLVRAVFGRGSPDTIAYLHLQHVPPRTPFTTTEGVSVLRVVVDPIAISDDWAMVSDGTIAILRGQDYHIDWISPNGTRASSAKLPFVWHRLSDSEKTAIVDSTKNALTAFPVRFQNPTENGQVGTGSYVPDVVAPEDLVEYRSPFGPRTMLADVEGNVWTIPTPEVPLSPEPGVVYDVISRRAGTLIDRVQLKPGFSIKGFAPGYLFMSVREGTGVALVKARVR